MLRIVSSIRAVVPTNRRKHNLCIFTDATHSSAFSTRVRHSITIAPGDVLAPPTGASVALNQRSGRHVFPLSALSNHFNGMSEVHCNPIVHSTVAWPLIKIL